MTYYYEGIVRLDLGFGNPNRTAALIACLMVGVWALAGFRKWGFWAAWAFSTGLGVLLVQTFSRGGFFAATVGTVILVILARRPWPLLQAALIASSLMALILYAIVLSATERVVDAWQGDPSVLNRLNLWKSVPRMLADAPAGWGLNQVQDAYTQWYQDPDRRERFLNLVSTHFTLLAELPWLARIGYTVAWAWVFLLTCPIPRLPCLAPAFSVAVTFFVAGFFTHFGASWLVYLPLFLAILAALIVRIRQRAWPSSKTLLCATGLAILVFLPVFFPGSTALPIKGAPGGTQIGALPAETWILVSKDVLGNSYGMNLRRFLQTQNEVPSWGFASDLDQIPSTKILIVCGDVDPEALLPELDRIKPTRLILLNTELFPSHFPEKLEIIPVFGEFAPSASASAWQETGRAVTLPGEGQFIRSWPQVLFEQLSYPQKRMESRLDLL